MTIQQGNKLRRLTLTMAGILCCGLAVSALSTASFAQTPTSTSQATMDRSHWVQAPGMLIRPDCVHEIPNGATVEATADGRATGNVTLNGATIAHYDPCPEKPVITRPDLGAETTANTESRPDPSATGNGWVEASDWVVPLSSDVNIDFMGGYWTVPAYPAETGAVIFLFNGVEPANNSLAGIVQPVLQFGVSAAGGGNYYAITSWFVDNDYVFHSPLVTVYPGDTILGVSEIYAMSGNTPYWMVEAKDETSGHYSWIKTPTPSSMHWVWALAGVLEAYNVSSCSQFPANHQAIFTESTVGYGFPSYYAISPERWVGTRWIFSPICGFKVSPGVTSFLDF